MHIKTLLIACMGAAMMTGCAIESTTQSGAVGADRKQFMIVSEEDAQRAGSAQYAQLKQQATARGALNSDKKQYDRLVAIANNIIPQTAVFRSDALSWKWEISLFNSDEINAFCMPGGKIGVYSGLINKLKLTDDEIAVVMGHEIAHALREHSREQMSQALGQQAIFAGLSIFTGMNATQLNVLQQASEVGLTLPHSRKDEREADRIGLELAARAGFNPRAGISVWKKMLAADGSGPPQFLSTHPAPESRIQDIEALMPIVMPLYEDAIKNKGHRNNR
ncbi:MAG: M48 family metallopeptidase [Gammaproteobacteria bacterium]